MHDWTIAREYDGGLQLRSELLAAGHDDRSIAREVAGGHLIRLRPGAYLPSDVASTLSPEDRHRSLSRAVLLQSRCRAVLSHGSALAEYDVPMWGVPLDAVHLTRLDDSAGRRHPQVVQHRGEVTPDDLVVRNGLTVTSAARTALDLCRVLPVEEAVVAVDGLLHAGLTDAEQVRERYESLRRRPGSLGTEVVLRLVDPRPESVGERRTQFLCWKRGLPAPEPQFCVYDQGALVARLDFAWPDRRVWLEFDGKVKYVKHLRPGETAADAVLREKRREDLIRRLTGWHCVRITWADLRDPVRLARIIREVFALAAAAA